MTKKVWLEEAKGFAHAATDFIAVGGFTNYFFRYGKSYLNRKAVQVDGEAYAVEAKALDLPPSCEVEK